MPPRQTFREFLAARGLTTEDWLELVERSNRRAADLHFAWVQAEDELARREGRRPDFDEAALAEMGISIDAWRAMKPGERVRTMARWFAQAPPDWWEA